jgi:hypothetical protein
LRNKKYFKNHDDIPFQMKALNQTSFSLLSLSLFLSSLGNSEFVSSARRWRRPPSLLRAKLWQAIGCKVLHINLFTAVLVTLIIRHGSSRHIERGKGERGGGFGHKEEASCCCKEENRTQSIR